MSDFRPTPDWPRAKGRWTQATGVCDARGMAYCVTGWDWDAVDLAQMAAHDVRDADWSDRAPA